MSVSRKGTIIRVDADNDTITGVFRIGGILYVPAGTTPSAQLKDTNTSGMILWESSGSTRTWEDVEIYLPNGTYHVDLAGVGTAIYLYLEAD